MVGGDTDHGDKNFRMEKYDGFESWLKANEYVSWKSYLSFMKQIDNTRMIKGFESITSVKQL